MKKPKILIVEDYRPFADTLGETCEEEAMEALVVYTGGEALQAFQTHQDLDLIVLDINLPDINGFEVCRRIREKSKIPIIFLTARKSDIDHNSGLEMGADIYLRKPVKGRVVVSNIRAMLRRTYDWSMKKESLNESGEKEASLAQAKKNEYTPHPYFEINDETKTICLLKKTMNLSSGDFYLMKEMVRHPGRVYSHNQLQKAIDGSECFSASSMYNRFMRIKKECQQIAPHLTLIENVRGLGYRIVPLQPED